MQNRTPSIPCSAQRQDRKQYEPLRKLIFDPFTRVVDILLHPLCAAAGVNKNDILCTKRTSKRTCCSTLAGTQLKIENHTPSGIKANILISQKSISL
jgi:hypothetical protein